MDDMNDVEDGGRHNSWNCSATMGPLGRGGYRSISNLNVECLKYTTIGTQDSCL